MALCVQLAPHSDVGGERGVGIELGLESERFLSAGRVGGVPGRPRALSLAEPANAEHVWNAVQTALQAPPDAPDAALDDLPALDARRTPWPLFVALLLSNGWFIKPVFFAQRPGSNPKDSVRRRLRIAFLRLIAFIGTWIAAFALLPIWIPAVALAAWMIMITPRLRAVHEAFQSVGDADEPDV